MSATIKQNRVWKQTGGYCVYCNTLISVRPDEINFRTVDHIIPKSRGGRATVGNLAPACLRCNNARKTYFPPSDIAAPEWRNYLFRKELALSKRLHFDGVAHPCGPAFEFAELSAELQKYPPLSDEEKAQRKEKKHSRYRWKPMVYAVSPAWWQQIPQGIYRTTK